jgi:uncharacterized Zn-finger protein
VTAIDFPNDPVTARRHRDASLVTHAADIQGIVSANNQTGGGYLKFRNDRGVPKICIGVREFKCIGVSPPQDHPHVYINMGEADTILLRDAVHLRSATDAARCRSVGQSLC